MEALIWIGLTALAIALPFYVPRWRLQRVLARPLPAEAQPFYTATFPSTAA